MIRVSRKGAAAVAMLALAAGAPELAYASPGAAPTPGTAGAAGAAGAAGDSVGVPLPPGWRVSGAGAGRELIWTPSEALPIGDARVEFHSGGRLLGVPVPDRRQETFRLRVGTARIGPGDELRVSAGGRSLDAAGRPVGAPSSRESARPRAVNPAPAPVNPVDPGVKGRYGTVSGEYSLASLKLPGIPREVEMKAVVVGPRNAPGKRPVALFLHGRHATCYDTTSDTAMDWPCADGYRQIPSYRGYLHDQRLLASQGYVTVSVSANGINAQDSRLDDSGAQARSSLVRQHLARLAGWSANPASAPAAVRALPRADLDKVLLVGHSRGGEGVNRAALDSLYRPPADQEGHPGPVRWTIRGTVLIGPTAFGQNPAPDVPSMTILPGCDGDVFDLQGQMYADRTRGISRGRALHSSVYMVGANHNFFNTEWTPGQAAAPATDDFRQTDDAVCSPGTATRLSAERQQRAGSTYIAAAARLFVAGDDKVRPLLDGSHRRAPSAGPVRAPAQAVGGNRTAAVLPSAATKVAGGRICEHLTGDRAKVCLPRPGGTESPHFAHWMLGTEPGRHSVTANWSRSGVPVRVTPERSFSLAGSRSLALRMFVPPNTTGTELDVAVTDTSGKRARLGRVTVDGLPGTDMTTSAWGRELRVPVKAAVAAGLDLRRVKSLELTPRTGSGKFWLVDAWGWRPGTPAVGAVAELPRVDLGQASVKEGDSGVRTLSIPARVRGRGEGEVRVFLPGSTGERPVTRTVTVKPGSGQRIELPVEVEGNTRWSHDIEHRAYVKAVRGAVIGSYEGTLTVRNDDPMPRVTLTTVADDVTEGRSLTWRVTLSEAVDTDFSHAGLVLRPVTSGRELDTDDVDRQWVETQFGTVPDPALPLSGLYGPPYAPYLWADIQPGRSSADISVPVTKDTVTEPEEYLRAQLVVTPEDGGEPSYGPEFTGTVRDAP
ncbi:hypothetical protein ACIBCB_07520 [Streptomyces uncialis]|uniref:hypothetical protein n=1 Tax=Streptomyces uncialis TaxID=1048205 RepID=UPI0037A166D5